MGSALYSWSGGKDAAYALDVYGPENVDALLTTVNGESERISIHGVRRQLLEKQAEAMGLPLETFDTSDVETMADYDRLVSEFYRRETYGKVVFGDIFLEENRERREERASGEGLEAKFPVWGEDTTEMAQDILDSGFKAVVVRVNAEHFDSPSDFVGRRYDEEFLEDLPPTVDPCGENGEFHTFVYDGPVFDWPVLQGPLESHVGKEEVREIDGSSAHYVDIVP
jgi:uncharacterized protein (TIGR00290 family)